jgi:predicted helicase
MLVIFYYRHGLTLDKDNGELFEQIKQKAVGKIVKPKKLSPRPHQKEAISKTIAYFKSNERGKMIMPCGTGKSLTAFWIAEKMRPKSILVAVPSLALLQQTLKVWTREFLLNNIEPDWLCVCSDDTVKEEQDDFVTFSADLGIKVDTDPRVIRNFLKKKTKKLKIVFTTYQSGRATAIGSKGFTYDLGIMDEAHKTVGSGKKPMAHLLHQKNIKINKRLFMTATERLFRGDSDEYMSMDDPRDYGNLIYELSFKEAINSKPPIISDYKIITFGITTPEIEKIAEDNKYLEVKKDLKDITARELATAIALRKAIKKLKIKNAISFHRSIKRAENFRKQQDLISKIYPTYGKLKTFHVRGDMPTSDRALEMLSFEEEQGLMTNARCLTEGVDLPAIDCVCFTDPKRSKVDIVQAAGRALRLAKGKKFGYILIPIFIPDGIDFELLQKIKVLMMYLYNCQSFSDN